MSAAWLQTEEARLHTSNGYCVACGCNVPPAGQNYALHVNGARHRAAAASLHNPGGSDVDEVDRLIAARHCALCGVGLNSGRIMIQEHVAGLRHRQAKRAQSAAGQPPPRPASSRAPPSAAASSSASSAAITSSFDGHPAAEDISSILRTQQCTRCNVRMVSPTVPSAKMHVEGAKHLLQIRLATWNPETGLAALQKEQKGISVELRFRGQLVPVSAASASAPPLRMEASETIPLRFDVVNRSSRPVHLNGVIAVPAAALLRMGINVRLPGGQRVTIPTNRSFPQEHALHGTVERIGTHRCLVVFQLSSALLIRVFDVSILPRGSSADVAALAPTSAFVPKDRRNAAVISGKYEGLEPGVKPTSATNAAAMYKRPLGFYDVPHSLVATLESASHRARLESLLRVPLDSSVYKARFQTLLHLEEVQMNGDIQDYDRQAALSHDRQRNGMIKLRVEGLAENRPSVQRGDQILASQSPFEGTRSKSRIFSGYVHAVELEFVYLRFSSAFHQSLINDAKYFLRFTFNRIPLRRCHAGVEAIVHNGLARVLFGRSVSQCKPMESFVYEPELHTKFLQTDNAEECDRWIEREVLRANVTAVGLDTESMVSRGPGFHNELALLQLATADAVLLFRIFRRETLPPRLVHLLGLASVKKYSVGPESELGAKFRVAVSPLVDVQRLSMSARGLRQLPGLQDMANAHLPELAFVKDTDMQLSDWETWPLSTRQMRYAAADATMALKLGLRLQGADAVAAAAASGSASASALVVQPDSMLARIGRAFLSSASSLLQSGPAASSAASSSSSSSAASEAAQPRVALGRTSRNLNAQQRQCVESIADGNYHPLPFLLFGPPGTGKTTVLVESINHLLQHPSSKSNPIRILAVAPSNAAADLIVERLANLNKMELFRLNAVSRSVSGVSELVRERSAVAPNNEGFLLQSSEALLRYRVIVSTCMSGSCLSAVGVDAGSFSHIFVDEAGHATEPEVLATLGGMLTPEKSRLILAGDPMQLGPIIRSKLAASYGLATSLLERLVSEANHSSSPYFRPAGRGPYPAALMVKLLHNYRSHPEILTVPNARFYDNELVAAADLLDRNSLCRWPGWPAPSFPLLLHHVKGEEQREGNSPSWFNTTEVVLVIDYVLRLLEWKQSGLTVSAIGIITPYAKQAHKIRDAAKRKGLDCASLKIGPVENFQGDERRVIIVSTVRSQLLSYSQFDTKFNLGFVNQPKRLNVALTRAKQGLIIVGNAELLETDPHWWAVVRHCANHAAVIGDFRSAIDANGQPIAKPAGEADDDLANIGAILDANAERQRRDDARAQEIANEDGQRRDEAPWREGDL